MITLFNHINLNFITVPTDVLHLNEIEWRNMIKSFLAKLSSKPYGNIITIKLINFISNGYRITVSNIDPEYHQTIYPKIKYIDSRNILIVYPNVAYFTEIEVENETVKPMSYFIGFTHELIHCLRHFEGFDYNISTEEANTIYGTSDGVLKYNLLGKEMVITENTIRTEWELPKRISHRAYEIYCYNIHRTYDNKSKFSKSDFFV
jgi:hypothetical protein